jgi:hypothetical protein
MTYLHDVEFRVRVPMIYVIISESVRWLRSSVPGLCFVTVA